MKIGINASMLRKPATGIGQVTEHFLKRLPQDKGHEYVVYVEEAFQGHGGWLHRADVLVRPILPWYRRDDLVRKAWWERFVLPQAVAEDGCEAFISLSQTATILPMNIRHTMVVHDMIPRIFPEYLDNLRKRLLWHMTESAIRRADQVVTVSRQSRSDVLRLLGLDPTRVITSTIAVDDIFRHPVSEEHRTRVLHRYGLAHGYIYHGGGLEVRKNTECLLLAYKHLLERYRREERIGQLPTLVISGRNRPHLVPLVIDIEKRVHELDLGPYVKLIGFVSQADLPSVYSGASMFVYPSLYEGFGMPVLEAMSQSVAVISSRAASLPEVGGDAVAYVDPRDHRDLAHAIDRFLIHPDGRQRFALHGREHSMIFSWDRFVDDVFGTLNNR